MFLVRGFTAKSVLIILEGQASDFLTTTFSSFEVDDPEEQAVAVMTNAITNGKDSFFSFMILLIGNP